MKITLNITFKTWRTWFELSTIALVFILFLLVNNLRIVENQRIYTELTIICISWILSIIVGLRKY